MYANLFAWIEELSSPLTTFRLYRVRVHSVQAGMNVPRLVCIHVVLVTCSLTYLSILWYTLCLSFYQ
ncbi:hypothetical protein BC629DRAFT_1734302 [Irpex lacteus]|nr:hypothetical protein BC629DRAFT_1734302 [Irpex lacteus]